MLYDRVLHIVDGVDYHIRVIELNMVSSLRIKDYFAVEGKTMRIPLRRL